MDSPPGFSRLSRAAVFERLLWKKEIVRWKSTLNPTFKPSLNKWRVKLAFPASNWWKTQLFDELAYTRQTLDRRYDDLESGRIKPISGGEVFARLRAKSAARRAEH